MGRFGVMHCLVAIWLGELDPRQCLMEGIFAYAVAAFCSRALLCAAWPNQISVTPMVDELWLPIQMTP